MTRTAIIAALPGELGPLVRGWRSESRSGVRLWRWRHGGGEWSAACAGIGGAAALRALAAIEEDGPATSLLSLGWAGALDPAFRSGEAFGVLGVIDAGTGEHLPAAPLLGGCLLVTATRVADRAEKARLRAAFGAGLVDMEAAALARLARTRGIPFQGVKGVSDGPDEDLPDLNAFISETGKFATPRFVAFSLLHPRYWVALARMGRSSAESARRMAVSALDILDAGRTLRPSRSGTKGAAGGRT